MIKRQQLGCYQIRRAVAEILQFLYKRQRLEDGRFGKWFVFAIPALLSVEVFLP